MSPKMMLQVPSATEGTASGVARAGERCMHAPPLEEAEQEQEQRGGPLVPELELALHGFWQS